VFSGQLSLFSHNRRMASIGLLQLSPGVARLAQ
jgi:hypothetical protein